MAKKISEMDEASNLLRTDSVPIIQNGENKSVTGEILKAFTNDGMQSDLTGGGLENVDLNNYKETGFYWVSQTNVSNKPATNFGYLEVIKAVKSTGVAMQRFTCYGNDTLNNRGDTYVRFFVNNQWYGWNKIGQVIT